MLYKVKRVEDIFMGLENQTRFLARCSWGLTKQPKSEEIKFIPGPNIQIHPHDVILPNNLSFQITPDAIANIVNQLLVLSTNPNKLLPLLKNLDQRLGQIMQEKGIEFSKTDTPQYLIAGNGEFIPGPPPADYQPKHKGKVLSQLLHEREKSTGINSEDYVAKFVGLVSAEDADHFVADGHLFSEDGQIARILFHGKETHRLFFEALRVAVEQRDINLTTTQGESLAFKQLLEILILVKHANGLNLWNIVMDTEADIIATTPYKITAHFLDPANYTSSCRSPYVLNSFLLCFGAEFGLENLQHALLDSHWKEISKMVNRVKSAFLAEYASGIALPTDDDLYTFCIEAQETDGNDPTGIGWKHFFTLSTKEALSNPKYVSIPVAPTAKETDALLKKPKHEHAGESSSLRAYKQIVAKTSSVEGKTLAISCAPELFPKPIIFPA
ncbi:MAG: hypothetical protein ACHP9Y_05875 [Gammaproteobacteria bacterium]